MDYVQHIEMQDKLQNIYIYENRSPYSGRDRDTAIWNCWQARWVDYESG
jgi:hypothetical protein